MPLVIIICAVILLLLLITVAKFNAFQSIDKGHPAYLDAYGDHQSSGGPGGSFTFEYFYLNTNISIDECS